MLNGLDLFSGIGGLTVALAPYSRPIAYCENDLGAQKNLMSLMWTGKLPMAPIWDDVSSLRARDLQYGVDIIYGGFPCQDISCAGTGKGLAGERSGLFYEIIRLTRELRPPFIFLENVPAITVRGLEQILLEFTAIGYDCRWTIVSAAEVGAIHIRERWFLLAHSNRLRLRQECGQAKRWIDAIRPGSMEPDGSFSPRGTAFASERLTKPGVDRTGDGISGRVDRHHRLGNAVIPAQARLAFEKLSGLK